MAQERILIVDDEEVLCRSLKMDFEEDGYLVKISNSGEQALELISAFYPVVVLLDLRLPGINGIEVLKKITSYDPDIAVIIMTAFGDTKITVEAVKCGAFHFINKPFELEELKKLVGQAIKSQVLKREVEYLRYQQRKIYRFCDLVGKSDKMMKIYKQIEVLSKTDHTTVLILGESGTGKELVASAIHFKSKRNKAPFMEINCASLPENLIESELFGYEKGAFTDAKQQKKGLLEIANNGTVFLDEIAEMPLSIQAKLLTFLEKKQFKRLGSGKDIKVDVRIITATNQDLVKAIEKKKFRKDLYYRLNVVSIHAPPLRERTDDILALSNYFLEEFSRDMGKRPKTLLPEVEDIFNAYPWHGNVRELRNVIERAVIFCTGQTVDKDLLPREMLDYKNPGAPKLKFGDQENHGREKTHTPIDAVLLKVEKQIIDDALRQTKGNKTNAARLLDISRYSLTRRINKLEKENKRQNK
ncbi:sigma-54 dependent transcriptional regulator [Desulfobacula sp.]|uniref:sigma-54-dependent transcriptional regulator n=1 Tax=Desulfobacula sp. TaxID=2593537 RepID=UPI0025C2DC2D|nr:sigma-54 dependent transcriptional regulator [Desulfobacula sp.]MBC2705424.1 sigma-54-dependent Fis family transcriptional regulator [Desulfobacula sp.]